MSGMGVLLGLAGPGQVWAGAEYVLAPRSEDCTQTEGHGFNSIQAALDAAEEGDIITLEAGTYCVNLHFPRRAVTLRGDPSASQADVILDGSGCVREDDNRCSVLTFDWSSAGGELAEDGPLATLENLTVTGGTGKGDEAYAVGGGISMSRANPSLTHLTLSGNVVRNCGGGMYLSGSSPTLTHVIVSGNSAEDTGGGMCLSGSSPTLTHVTLSGNSASFQGGGMYLSSSSPTLTHVILSGSYAYKGGGMYLWESSPSLSHVTLSGNSAFTSGGGMYLLNSSPALHNTIVTYNLAGYGSNFLAARSYPGISTPTFNHTLWWLPSGEAGVLGGDLSASDSALIADPLFYDDPTDGTPHDDDHHLRPGSPAVDAGDGVDPDGSSADLGAYGGGGTLSGDADEDGAPDDWERVRGLDTHADADADADGLTDAEEFALGTDPLGVDSDGDGRTDAAEGEEGTDPLDATDPGIHPDEPGVVYVPDDFATLQAAAKAVAGDATIRVRPGVHSGTLTVWYKGLVIESTDGPEATILDGNQAGSVVTLGGTPETTTLRGFTLTGGLATDGGGILAIQAQGALSHLTVSGNSVLGDGGGMSLGYSSLTLTHLAISGNAASDSGGGMYLRESSPRLTHVILSGNSCSSFGGGMTLSSSSPTLTHVTLSGNASSSIGGGMYMYLSSPTLTHVTFSENSAAKGGGMLLYGSDPTLTHVTFAGNSASAHGGGMDLTYSDPMLSYVTITGNSAALDGGGMSLNGSSPRLSHVTLTGNSASAGGGMYLFRASTTLHNTIVALNDAPTGANIHVRDEEEEDLASLTLTRALLYAGPGDPGVDSASGAPVLLSDPPIIADPLFVGPDVPDIHLVSPHSPAIDAGADSGCHNPLTGALDAPCQDPDGSLADLGAWGGPGADEGDMDGDGAAAPWWPTTAEGEPAVALSYETSAFDCDDNDPSIGPPETAYWLDSDGDGHGTSSASTLACALPAGFADTDGDCDDDDPTRHPGAPEGCDGIDTDCDGQLGPGERDDDGDGYTECANDCDDDDPAIHPDADEICDGLDNDCDGHADEGFDLDGDGHLSLQTCPDLGDDCDDEAPHRNPDADEICDDLDNDCDGQVDEGFDLDGDGHLSIETCPDLGDDCDDEAPHRNPDADEICDGLDNDCDGYADEGFDLDGDGHLSLQTCPDLGDDCDDHNPDAHPGADEVTDGQDNDCDGEIPEVETSEDAGCGGPGEGSGCGGGQAILLLPLLLFRRRGSLRLPAPPWVRPETPSRASHARRGRL